MNRIKLFNLSHEFSAPSRAPRAVFERLLKGS